jgi:hypothetical protein
MDDGTIPKKKYSSCRNGFLTEDMITKRNASFRGHAILIYSPLPQQR